MQFILSITVILIVVVIVIHSLGHKTHTENVGWIESKAPKDMNICDVWWDSNFNSVKLIEMCCLGLQPPQRTQMIPIPLWIHGNCTEFVIHGRCLSGNDGNDHPFSFTPPFTGHSAPHFFCPWGMQWFQALPSVCCQVKALDLWWMGYKCTQAILPYNTGFNGLWTETSVWT